MKQLDLFPVEAKKKNRVVPELPKDVEFPLELSDGTKLRVVFEYITSTMPHFEFNGDISEKGYYSYFPGYAENFIPEDEIKPMAIKAAESIRAGYLEKLAEKLAKQQRKTKRGK